MLPKLISNIILAVIAIFVLYTLAPAIKDFFSDLFGKGKKKHMSKQEFDDMVQRKVDQLSGGNSLGTVSSLSKSSPAKIRTEWNYLEENDYFPTPEDNSDLKKLKDSTQWGAGDEIENIVKEFQKATGISLEETVINKYVKIYLSKKEIIKLFPNKGITLKDFIDKLNLIIVIDKINQSDTELCAILAKKLNLNNELLQLLCQITVNKQLDREWLSSIEEFIESGSIAVNLGQAQYKISTVSDLLKMLRKNLDIVIPLKALTKKEVKDKIFANEKDKELLKKKYKKLVSIYHPDKWSYLDKTTVIDERLRENFDLVKKVYEELNS